VESGKILLTREFLDELFIQRLVNMKTHPKVGDLPIRTSMRE
jgi:hypothetical protein